MSERPTDMPEPKIDVTRMLRIEPLEYDEADEPTQQLWDEQRSLREQGRIGPDTTDVNFKMGMNHPELMALRQPYSQYLKNSQKLSLRDRELAIMRSAWLCGSDVQFVNHTKIGMDCGLTRDDIDRIPAGPDAPGWSEGDAAVLRGVDELHYWCRIGDDTWAALARKYDKRQLIEFLHLVGNYRTIAYTQSAIGVRPVTGTSPNISGNRFLFPST